MHIDSDHKKMPLFFLSSLLGIFTRSRQTQSIEIKYDKEQCREKLGAKTELSVCHSLLCRKSQLCGKRQTWSCVALNIHSVFFRKIKAYCQCQSVFQYPQEFPRCLQLKLLSSSSSHYQIYQLLSKDYVLLILSLVSRPQ